MLLLTAALLLGFRDPWPIYLSDHQVFQPGLLAASPEGGLALAVPRTHELRRPVCRLRLRPQAFVVDPRRQLRHRAFPQTPAGNTPPHKPGYVLTARDVTGLPGSTPALASVDLATGRQTPVWHGAPFTKANGYAHPLSPGAPISLPWHPRLLLSQGKRLVAVCDSRTPRIHLFDRHTLQPVAEVTLPLPRVQVDETDYREALQLAAKDHDVPASGFILEGDGARPYYPAPIAVLLDPDDQLWVFQHRFQGFMRHKLTHTGTVVAQKPIAHLPSALSRKHHFALVTSRWGEICITREE